MKELYVTEVLHSALSTRKMAILRVESVCKLEILRVGHSASWPFDDMTFCESEYNATKVHYALLVYVGTITIRNCLFNFFLKLCIRMLILNNLYCIYDNSILFTNSGMSLYTSNFVSIRVRTLGLRDLWR